MRHLVGALAALLLLTGCTGDPERKAAPTSPTPPSVDKLQADATEAVLKVALVPTDLPEGSSIELIPGGDRVDGQPTLDECGETFPSETARLARRQVDVHYPQGVMGAYSNEVVAYDSQVSAEQALREWRRAVQSCPEDEFRLPGQPGVPEVRTSLLEFHTLQSLPVPNNAVARQLVVARTGTYLYLSIVMQQHGRVLDAHYLTTQKQPTRRQVARLTTQARETGARLLLLAGGTTT